MEREAEAGRARASDAVAEHGHGGCAGHAGDRNKQTGFSTNDRIGRRVGVDQARLGGRRAALPTVTSPRRSLPPAAVALDPFNARRGRLLRLQSPWGAAATAQGNAPNQSRPRVPSRAARRSYPSSRCWLILSFSVQMPRCSVQLPTNNVLSSPACSQSTSLFSRKLHSD